MTVESSSTPVPDYFQASPELYPGKALLILYPTPDFVEAF